MAISPEGYDRIRRGFFAPDTEERHDEAFGEITVGRGYLTQAQLEAAAEEHRSEASKIPLAQFLVRQGLLSADQFLAAVQIQSGDLAWCRRCNEVCEAAGAAVRCPRCGRELGPRETAAATGAERRIGKYRVHREIARGGMGVVLEAQDTETGDRVALKVILERQVGPERIERLRREAEIARRLTHPNIVRIHELGVARDGSGDPLHFVAMDYIEGRTLAQILHEKSTERRECLGILEQVARAVAHAHTHGVLHRDLKPSNVIVDAAGRAFLTDFGLARDTVMQSPLTPSYSVMGTVQYMAPEQVKGITREVGTRADVYALGVMLYEVVTGRPPFRASSLEKLFEQILKGEPEAPDDPADADLMKICRKAMSKSPLARYPSAIELADELSRCLAKS